MTFDKYGYPIFGYESHVKTWRYWLQRKREEEREAWRMLAKRR